MIENMSNSIKAIHHLAAKTIQFEITANPKLDFIKIE